MYELIEFQVLKIFSEVSKLILTAILIRRFLVTHEGSQGGDRQSLISGTSPPTDPSCNPLESKGQT